MFPRISRSVNKSKDKSKPEKRNQSLEFKGPFKPADSYFITWTAYLLTPEDLAAFSISILSNSFRSKILRFIAQVNFSHHIFFYFKKRNIRSIASSSSASAFWYYYEIAKSSAEKYPRTS